MLKKKRSEKPKNMLYPGDQSGTKYFPLLWIFFLIGVSDCGLCIEGQRSGEQVREKGSKGLQKRLIQTLRGKLMVSNVNI